MVVKLGAAYRHLSQPLVPHHLPLTSLSTRRHRPTTTSTHLGLWLLRSRSHHQPHASPDDKGPAFNPQKIDLDPPSWLERPNWLQAVEVSSTPLSTPATKKKQKTNNNKSTWRDGLKETGENAATRAFSSMVFIIRELHSYTLHLRELLLFEDLRGIVGQVQTEMHASFCWLFHHIFSCTPTLMVSLMLLLANFTVHSMTHTAIAAPLVMSPQTPLVSTAVYHARIEESPVSEVDAPSVETTHVDGGGAEGSWVRPVARGMGEGGRGAGVVLSKVEEEGRTWRRVVEAAAEMEAEAGRHQVLRDRELLRGLVAPITVEVESDRGYPEYFRTELMYQRAVEESPHDQLLLSNYAQFLFLVVHDHDRAEHYFKRAIGMKPVDAETLNRYANFLWVAKKDLCQAEEMYLEAIDADPSNTCYAASYAHFLWSTGGEDTCFPLDDGLDA